MLRPEAIHYSPQEPTGSVPKPDHPRARERLSPWYRRMIDTFNGDIPALQGIPKDHLDWAGYMSVFGWYENIVTPEGRTSLLRGHRQVIERGEQHPEAAAGAIHLAYVLNLAVDESVQILSETGIESDMVRKQIHTYQFAREKRARAAQSEENVNAWVAQQPPLSPEESERRERIIQEALDEITAPSKTTQRVRKLFIEAAEKLGHDLAAREPSLPLTVEDLEEVRRVVEMIDFGPQIGGAEESDEELQRLEQVRKQLLPYYHRYQLQIARAKAGEIPVDSPSHPDQMSRIGSTYRKIRRSVDLSREQLAEEAEVDPIALFAFEGGLIPPDDLPEGFVIKLGNTLQEKLKDILPPMAGGAEDFSEQLQDFLKDLLKRGTITPEQADLLNRNALYLADHEKELEVAHHGEYAAALNGKLFFAPSLDEIIKITDEEPNAITRFIRHVGVVDFPSLSLDPSQQP